MHLQPGTTAAVVIITLLVCPGLVAAEPQDRPATTIAVTSSDPTPVPFFSGPVPRSSEIAADARLNDVCAVGSQIRAVGERGVIVTSSDTGATWTTRMLPFECSLQSVCFLTNQVGYVAGSRFDPFTREARGVLLTTRDGGETWLAVDEPPARRDPSAGVLTGVIRGYELPGLRFVKFFDLDRGVVLTCLADPQRAVLQTSDGGRTWTPILPSASDEPSDWNYASFSSPDDGLVVGASLAYGAVVGSQLVGLGQSSATLRRIRAASVNENGRGWIAGDGGFLLHSDNGGISWRLPATPLPQQLTDVFDFAAAAQQGSTVCIAGSPGSAIIHSDDDGLSWSLAATGSPGPVRRLIFVAPSVAIAVGELGTILKSADGGRTWSTVRSAGLRCAVLSLVTEPQDVSLLMLSAVSGNDGFRSVVLQPSVERIAGRVRQTATDERFVAAVSQAGGNVADSDWIFPRTAPQHHLVKSQLVESWNRQTDGRLGELLPLRLARAIRTFRPDVITIERSSEEDRVAEIWADAIEVARRIADGSDVRAAALDAAMLEPWHASRVLLRTTGDERSALTFAADDLLSELGTTPALVADAGQRWLGENKAAGADGHAAYRVYDTTRAAATPATMFSKLPQQPGSASRRATALSAGDTGELQRVLQKFRVTQAALTGHVQHLNSDVSLTAHVRQLGTGLPATLALQQLSHLVDLHFRNENTDGLIAVLQEIIRRFPESSDAVDAARMLFMIYSSDEIRLLRNRAGSDAGSGSSGSGAASEQAAVPPSAIEQAAARIPGLVHAPEIRQATGVSLTNPQDTDRAAVSDRWNKNAAKALEIARRIEVPASEEARLLLREAANLNRQRLFGEHNTVLSRAAALDGPFAVFARAELQAVHGAATTPIPVVNLPESSERPFLDGILNDACWQAAKEIRLRSVEGRASGPESDSLLMIAWDREFLYVAGRLERVLPPNAIGSRLPDRRHDADHGTRDRIELAIDTDRDYSTAFRFSIDETGQTSERCWIAGRWNPEWFVAIDSDADVWRFEAAIPASELTDTPLAAGTLWAVQLDRIIPGHLRYALLPDEHPDDSSRAVNGTEGFGLIRCIRNRP